ncbi:type II toxin-antitoxin system VapC family toxin [Deinococcus sp. NW-56]|uniref:type II toxin-antitoxin system VapC family toxin n=1 Tax=Deinococcus sp. NW-56 TaxID=2080419 RepID=UPI001F3EEFF6|nr:type II toxin-antitoxin system VapC family toxin [Deinococcus sp. NW-56]
MTLGTPILLDTNVLSETAKKRPDPTVTAYLADLDFTQTFIGAASVAEIERGIHLLRGREPVRAQRLQTWLEAYVLPRFGERVLPFDLNVAREWGRLMGTEAARRQPPPLLDSLLAATASAHRLTLVTRNTADFLAFPVAVYNPWNHPHPSPTPPEHP